MMGEIRKVLEWYDRTNYTSVTNGTVELDNTFKMEGRPTTKIVHTAGANAQVLSDYPNGVKMVGQYIKLALKVYENVERVTLLFFVGPTSEGNYYSRTLLVSSGQLVIGTQMLDCHLSQMPKTGNPDPKKPITSIRIQVASTTAAVTGGAVSVGLLHSVSRKPYIVFVNDDGYRSYVEDVIPMLDARNLPHTILWTQDSVLRYRADALANTPDVLPPGRISLNHAKEIMSRPNAYGGIHVDCQAADLAVFKENIRLQMETAGVQKLIKGKVHVCSLQNNFVSNERWAFLRSYAATMRLGTGQSIVSSVSLNNRTYILPAAATKINSLPITEFGLSVTPEVAAGWITDAISTETALYVFGHGTNREDPTNAYRSTIETYQEFFKKYDSVSDQIDWISMDELYERYVTSRKDTYTSISPLTYAI